MRLLPTLLIAVPACTLAANPFDGTWLVDRAQQPPGKPDVYVVEGGAFNCSSCEPSYSVPADGKDYKTPTNPYHDMVAATVVNAQTIKLVFHKAGRLTAIDTLTVSPDGKNLTDHFEKHVNEQVFTAESITERVAASPPGAHAISGSWDSVRQIKPSESSIFFKLHDLGNTLEYHDGTGASYKAKFDGADYPERSTDPNKAVSIKRIDARTIEQTDKIGGKATGIMRLQLSEDGKVVEVTFDDIANGAQGRMRATKQPPT